MTLEEYEALMARVRSIDGNFAQTTSPSMDEPMPRKRKRKRSKYQMELSRQLKKLTRAHPRTKVTNLMKRAHRATRKALK